MSKKAVPPTERFWAKVTITDGCWEFGPGRDRNGYGVFWTREGTVTAHKFSYVLAFGDVPPEMVIMHTCDNPACVRPEHLKLGTMAENNADCIARGRWGYGVASMTRTPKTHCPRNHPLEGGNLRVVSGRRHCRKCGNEWQKAYRERKSS